MAITAFTLFHGKCIFHNTDSLYVRKSFLALIILWGLYVIYFMFSYLFPVGDALPSNEALGWIVVIVLSFFLSVCYVQEMFADVDGTSEDGKS